MALEIRYICRGPRDTGALDGKTGGVGRVGCGADVGSLIRAVPQDGKNHDIKCPKCGMKIAVMRTLPASLTTTDSTPED